MSVFGYVYLTKQILSLNSHSVCLWWRQSDKSAFSGLPQWWWFAAFTNNKHGSTQGMRFRLKDSILKNWRRRYKSLNVWLWMCQPEGREKHFLPNGQRGLPKEGFARISSQLWPKTHIKNAHKHYRFTVGTLTYAHTDSFPRVIEADLTSASVCYWMWLAGHTWLGPPPALSASV